MEYRQCHGHGQHVHVRENSDLTEHGFVGRSKGDVFNGTFQSTRFNQDISGWHTSKTVYFNDMFNGNSSFNQNIGSWDISHVTSMNDMFTSSAMSISNYNSTLNGWAAQASSPGIQSNVPFNAGGSKYTAAASAARSTLATTKSWTITGDSLAAAPDAPTITGTTRGDGQVTVAWTPGADNGATITGYTVTAAGAGTCSTSSGTSCTVTGLTNGTTYSFTVTATNAAGTSSPSTAVAVSAGQELCVSVWHTDNDGDSITLPLNGVSGHSTSTLIGVMGRTAPSRRWVMRRRPTLRNGW